MDFKQPFQFFLLGSLLFLPQAYGNEIPQPAPCDISIDGNSIVSARLCVHLDQKTIVSLCDGKICQFTASKDVHYRTSSHCGDKSDLSINPDFFYKYPFEVFIDQAGERFSGKNLKTPQIVARIYQSDKEAASITLRNPEALQRLVDTLNKNYSLQKIAVRVLKLYAYPIGTVFYQADLNGFKKISQEKDLVWTDCKTGR